MKFTEDEAFLEITKRGAQIRKKKQQRQVKILSAASFMLTFALIGVLGVVGDFGLARGQTTYGSLMLSAESGGYILVAVLAFALGVLITITIQKYRKMKEKL